MGGTHEAWGLWILATLKLAAGASGSGICEGNRGFLGGEVASLAGLHLRVNISATTDQGWGAYDAVLVGLGMGQHLREVGTAGLGPLE